MVQVSSQLTEAEWVRFNLKYQRATAKQGRDILIFVMSVVLFLGFVYSWCSRLSMFQNMPLSLFRSFISQTLVDKTMLVFIFFVLMIDRLIRLDSHTIQRLPFTKKRLERWMQLPENRSFFGESRVVLEQNGVSTFSESIDLRIAWEAVSKVIETEELLVVMASPSMCIAITKSGLKESEISAIRECIQQNYLGELISLSK